MKRQKFDVRARYKKTPLDVRNEVINATSDGNVIWVKNEEDQEVLWYGGCFGRGLLSRTQPVFVKQNIIESTQPLFELNNDTVQNPDVEWMVISPFEVIYLQWALKCLQVNDINNNPIQTNTLWRKYLLKSLASSEVPQSQLEGTLRNTFESSHFSKSELISIFTAPFFINYIVYHYYRVAGFIVRSGLKYGAQFALYESSPTISHSKILVSVVPVISWMENELDVEVEEQQILWHDVMSSIRVSSNVKKIYRLMNVIIKLPRLLLNDDIKCHQFVQSIYSNPDEALKIVAVRDVTFHRFTPDQNKQK